MHKFRLLGLALLAVPTALASLATPLSGASAQGYPPYPHHGPGVFIGVPPPPPPREVPPPPPPGPPGFWIWQPGHWLWNGASYYWAPGHWERRPHPAAVWIAPHWQHGPGGWFYTEGHWRY